MLTDRAGVTDSVVAVLGHEQFKPIQRPGGAVGLGGSVHAKLWAPDGTLKQYEYGFNLVTDYGDEHVGERMRLDSQDIVTGMRLGTGATAASKSGAGAAIVTYISGSQEALDAVAGGTDLGGGSGFRIDHICTYIAGDVTNGAIAEVVLTDETPITDVAGVVGDTVARFVFAATIDKQAGDSLVVTWNVDFLGA